MEIIECFPIKIFLIRCIERFASEYNIGMRIKVRKKTREQHPANRTAAQRMSKIAQPLGMGGNDEDSGIESDVLGSYTGTAADGTAPEQDADDL